ncbi:circularly permuted type 2 ATP-grasp protein [Leptospira sp. GIMC2001]|nr:circularly permuted type 2 ATP-grasp protein [Leptospira sp. GIMC2001]WCL51417.1 circularly permuted type 2 ATP-grasp protein [Leptospira sp. GIMC2001]
MELENLTQGYTPLSSIYDELFDEGGSVRPKYSFLLRSFMELGPQELMKRRQDADRILQENGVTYNVYGSQERHERSWAMDLFPVLMESDEWRKLERGLDQRAELLNSILKDVYGSRRLVFEKRIPAELIFGSPGFLRPCDMMFAQHGLSFFACDLIRDKNGNFNVLSDRIQAPSGSGYSLENRIVLSRIFPSIYRDSQVHRVASYFRSLRKNLHNLSGVQGRDPIVVLLTPGPGNETFFEHAYLASYLGYTLVQGEDLTVRSNFVYMKTVEGLQKVDLILKRVDDYFMDALELKGDSLLGVPGLLEVVRSGNVKVANPIGSAILENRAFMPFMSELCRFYLGEELILPTIPSYWMGRNDDFQTVMEHPQNYIFKSVFPSALDKSYWVAQMSDAESNQLLAQVRLNPNHYIAQEILASSTTPILTQNGLVPGRAIYRTFVTASDSGYVTMSGGLVRVTTDLDEIFITNQRGALSKDLWVLASESQKEESIQVAAPEKIAISRNPIGVPSRVADNLFWFARYSERAENTARVLREAINEILKYEDSYDNSSIHGILKLITHITSSYPGFLGDDSDELLGNPFPEIQRLLYSQLYGGSMVFNLNGLSNSAKNVRDRLSDDTRKIVQILENRTTNMPSNYDSMLEDIFQNIILLSSLSGLSFENLSRESGWYFLELGRRLERSLNLIRILQGIINFQLEDDRNALESLLNISDIRITYRRRYRYKMEIEPVFDILMFDDSNPRSLGFQFEQLNEVVKYLPGKNAKKMFPEDRQVLELYTAYKLKDASMLVENGRLLDDECLQWLGDLEIKLKNLSETITGRYFNYTESQSFLGDTSA